MVPTLLGRIQTRLFLLATVGVIITLLVVPVLPGPSGPLGDRYAGGFLVLVAVGVLGIVWELIYHFLMQFRWEKDWPTFFGLITAVNEGVLVWLLLELEAVPGIDRPVPFSAFLLQFVTTWLVVWSTVNGPMRVPFVHWRFRGGRIV